MRHALIALSLLLLPKLVHADDLRVTSYDVDDSGGMVHLASNTAIGEPWLRIDNHVVRVWFPHIANILRFDHERQTDDAIHALMLRPGPADTAVLRIELGAARRVSTSDIEITRQDGTASVRIRVPPVVRLDPPVPATRPLATTQPQPAPARPTPPVAARARVPAVQTSVSAASQPPAAPPEPAETPVVQPGLATTAAVSSPAAALPAGKASPLAAATQLSQAGQSTWVTLGTATLVLGAMLGGLQLYNRRRGITHKPAIEVLGTRRLGHRQELMIVRALGSDHLLLCTAGRAERVASTPTPPLPPEETLHLPPTPPTSQAGGIGLISRLSSQHRLRKLLDNVEAEAEAEADAAPEQPAYGRGFGAELYSATRKQGSGLYSVPVRPQSDAVAGISRLRKRTAT